MKIYPNVRRVVKKVVASSGAATFRYNENRNRTESIRLTQLIFDTGVVARDQPIVKPTLNDIRRRSDVFNISTGTVRMNEPESRGDLLGAMKLALVESQRRPSAANFIITLVTPQTGTFKAPITGNLTVEMWGSGASGRGATVNGGGGGGGGAYASSVVAVVSGTNYPFVLPAGGVSPTFNGADATFNTTTVVAKGGTAGTAGTAGAQGAGGAGGSAASSTGTTKFSGGTGGGGGGVNVAGGGGGGGAGSAGNGGAGVSSGAPGAGGTLPGQPGGGGFGGSGVVAGSSGAVGQARFRFTV